MRSALGKVVIRLLISIRALVRQPLVAISTLTLALLVIVLDWSRSTGVSAATGTSVSLALSTFLVLTAVATYQFPLHLSRHSKVYLSSVPQYLLAVLMVPSLASLASGLGVLLGEISVNHRRGNYPSDIATQVGRRMLVVYLGSAVARLGASDPMLHLIALMGTMVVMLLGDILTSPLVLTPVTGVPPTQILRMAWRESSPVEAAQYLLGLLAALGALHHFWLMAVLALPLALVYHAFRASAAAREAQQAAEGSELLKGAILRTALDAIITFNDRGVILEFNPAAETLFACECSDAATYNVADYIVHPAFRLPSTRRFDQFVGAQDAGPGRHEVAAKRSDGTEFLVEMTLTRLPVVPPLYVAFVRDITAQRQAREALRYQALHDSLTGLPNRALLLDRLHHAILTAARQKTSIALLVLDLDRFKEVNDTFGHQPGDVLLHDVADRLHQAVRESDTVARLGGDEFAIVLPVHDLSGALRVVHKIQNMLTQPFLVEDQQLIIRASIGIVLYPQQGSDSSNLLRRADIAMYAAKRLQKGYALYTSEQDIYSRNRLALITDLQRAIERDELVLHYQPIVQARTGQLTCVEALVRWNHPQRGLVPPNNFIPLIEETGLVEQFTRWVIDAAVRQCRTWQSVGLDLAIAVNISVHALRRPGLTREIEELVQTSEGKLLPLKLELTESSLMTDPDWAMAALQPLHSMGIRISIDDFGTGYSSLARLKHLPVDEIKIDRTFVQSMCQDNGDAAIVRSIVDLAHNLGLAVVAEGCENQATWDMLADLNCDLVQGYYFSKPLSAADLYHWLKQRQLHLVRPASKQDGSVPPPSNVNGSDGGRGKRRARSGTQ